MRTKHLKADYASVEDRRGEQKPNYALKTDSQAKKSNYKEDPSAVSRRILLSSSYEKSVEGSRVGRTERAADETIRRRVYNKNKKYR